MRGSLASEVHVLRLQLSTGAKGLRFSLVDNPGIPIEVSSCGLAAGHGEAKNAWTDGPCPHDDGFDTRARARDTSLQRA